MHYQDQNQSQVKVVSSILNKYNCNSSILFPCIFNSFLNNVAIEQYKSALFCGNIGDIWSFLSHNLKPEIKLLGQIDSNIMKKIALYAQINCLKMCFKRLPKDQILRQKIKEKYKSMKGKKEDEFLKYLEHNCLSSQFCTYLQSFNEITIPNTFMNISQEEDCSSKSIHILCSKMLTFLKNKVKTKNYQDKNYQDKRRQKMMTTLILHLQFLLENSSWSKLCMQEEFSSKMQLFELSQPGGSIKLITFYNDAPYQIMQNEEQMINKIFKNHIKQ